MSHREPLGNTPAHQVLDDRPRVFLVGSKAAQEVLEGAGFDVVHVTSCETGLNLLMADIPADAVVLDVPANGSRELEVCQRFRLWNLFPRLAMVVLVDPGVALEGAVEEWATAVVAKPVAAGVLVDRVRDAMAATGTRERLTLRQHRAPEVLIRRTRELEAVRLLTGEIVRVLDFGQLLTLIVKRAVEFMEATEGVLWVLDSRTNRLCPVEWSGREPSEEERRGIRIVAGTRDGQRGAVDEIVRALERAEDLVVPLVCRREVVGALVLRGVARGEDGETLGDRDSLVWFAGSVAIALANATLHAQAVRRSEEREAILSALKVVLSGERLQDVLDRLVGVTAGIAGSEHVHVLLLEEGGDRLRVMARQGVASVEVGETVPVAGTLPGVAVRTGTAVFSGDCQQDPRNGSRAQDRTVGIRSLLCLPIRSPKRMLGVLSIGSTHRVEEDAWDVGCLASLADHVALAVEQSHLFEELRRSYDTVLLVQRELVRAEKLRSLGELSAGIAHDLNNLLSIIVGQTEVILRRAGDERTKEAGRTVYQAATGAQDVVRRVQTFARRDGGEALTRCVLRDLVAETLDLTRTRWRDQPEKEGRPITAVRKLSGLPPVLGTGAEIREVLTNLILNAVDAMPQGGTLLLTGTEVRDEGGRDWVELRVTDTGMGIPESVREKIFDPFFTTKGLNGSGLGLSVAYGIMQRLGGTIRVEQTGKGEGTTFVLRFAVDTRGPERSPLLDARPMRTYRILIVDDNARDRRLLRTLLQSVGHRVAEADTVDAAMARVHEGAVDLVCADIRMPGKDGFALVRALEPSKVPVIVVTGFDVEAESARREPGVAAVVQKPVDVPTLVQTVATVMGAVGQQGGDGKDGQ